MTDDAKPFDLKSEIDSAAGHLLKIITAEDAKTTIKERVDAFNAIVKWHEFSAKLAPPEVKEEKDAPIDKLKRKFNGTAKRGSRGSETTQ